MNIAAYIDHTILKPTTTDADITRLCREAASFGFAAVCVPPYYVHAAKVKLQDTGVKIATVVGFPFGYSSTAAKVEEIKQALSEGADELDMVINLAALKNADWAFLEQEVGRCTEIVHTAGKVLKLIVESGVLTDEEIIRCCTLVRANRVDFIKTSTGYAAVGATVHAVELMRQHLPDSVFIKASGGIRSFVFAKELIEAGANRLGCSAGIQILEESKTA